MSTGMDDNIKRRFYFVLILVVVLYGCAGDRTYNRDTYTQNLDTLKKQIMDWATAEKARVAEGSLKESEYWKLFFRKALELRPDLDNYLFFANEMIKVSRIYEEEKITREQFEDKYRQLSSILNQEDSRRSVVLSQIQTLHFYEMELFYCHRNSLFMDYANNLKEQLALAGSQFSFKDCAVFGDSIQCTSRSLLFP